MQFHDRLLERGSDGWLMFEDWSKYGLLLIVSQETN